MTPPSGGAKRGGGAPRPDGRLWHRPRPPADPPVPAPRRPVRAGLAPDIGVVRAGPGWHGRVGVVTTLIPAAHCDPDRTPALVCGPELMMQFAVRELGRRGVPGARTWVSLERNMKCAIGLCGHCQIGPRFVCKDGPVFRWDRVAPRLAVREL